MSKQAAREFCEKIKTDRALGEKLSSLHAGFKDDDVVRIARDAGFDCTVDELDAVGREMSSELGDDDLAHIAGGVGPGGSFPTGDATVKLGVQSLTYASTMKWNVSKG